MKNNLARKVNLREGGLGDIAKPVAEIIPINRADYNIRRFGVHHYNRAVDKLAKDLWMPKECTAAARRVLRADGVKLLMVGTTKEPAVTAQKPKRKLVVAPKPKPGPKRKLQQASKDPNMDLTRATDVLRSQLGGTGDAPKLEVREVAKVAANLTPKRSRAQRPEITGTDLVDGRKHGKWIITLRRKKGIRTSQHIGKRLLVIAERNVGRGQVFYLAAAYGVLESR